MSYRYGYRINNVIADSIALYTLAAVSGDPLMSYFFISADIGAQIQHGNRSITHLCRRSIDLLQERAIKAVELEHRDSICLAKIGILVFGKLFIILSPCVCCQYIRTAIGIVHGQLLVAHMLVPLGSIKFCFFQQHRIVHKISFLGNGTFEQCIQVWMAVYRYDRLTFGILISAVGFNEHHLPEKEGDLLFRREVVIDIEMAVLDKGEVFHQNLL